MTALSCLPQYSQVKSRNNQPKYSLRILGEVPKGERTVEVETLADIIQTGNTPLTIGVFGG
jgi:hypothetical protein